MGTRHIADNLLSLYHVAAYLIGNNGTALPL